MAIDEDSAAGNGSDDANKSGARFRRARAHALSLFLEFDSTLDAVRDLAVNAKAHTKPLDDGSAYFLKLVRRWNAHDSDERILAVLHETARLLAESLPPLRQRIEGGGGSNFLQELTKSIRDARETAIAKHVVDPGDRLRYSLDVQRSMDRRSRDTALRSSLLVSAVGSFEVLVGNMVRAYFIAFPKALINSEVSISTEYLATFEFLDDFWSAYGESRVEKLMREDVVTWLAWYEKNLNMTSRQVCPDAKTLVEIFLTRNVHVHNAGKANEVYLRACTRHNVTPRNEAADTRLPITQTYLIGAIDLLHVTGMLLAYGVLRKIATKYGEPPEFANSLLSGGIYSLLEDERYDAVLALAQLLPEMSPSRTDIVRINTWVAQREKEGPESIRAEMEIWDTSGKDAKFELVRLALLEDYSNAHSIADKIFGSDQLSRADWNSWPALKGLRCWVSADPDRGRFLLRERTISEDDSEPTENDPE